RFFRSEAGAIPRDSRYLATVRRATANPCCSSAEASLASDSGLAFGSWSTRRFNAALTEAAEAASPLSEGPTEELKKYFSSNTPSGQIRYLPLHARETVDSCSSVSSAI